MPRAKKQTTKSADVVPPVQKTDTITNDATIQDGIRTEDLVRIDDPVYIIEDNDKLNQIIMEMKATLGNTSEWNKLTTVYVQGKEQFKGLPLEVMLKNDYVYLMFGLLNPQKPGSLLGVMPIAFKDDIFTLKASDYNQIANMVQQVFEQKLADLKKSIVVN